MSLFYDRREKNGKKDKLLIDSILSHFFVPHHFDKKKNEYIEQR